MTSLKVLRTEWNSTLSVASLWAHIRGGPGYAGTAAFRGGPSSYADNIKALRGDG